MKGFGSIFVLLTGLMVSTTAEGVVFGADSRREPIFSAQMLQLARATAVMFSPLHAKVNGRGRYDFDYSSLQETVGLCSDQPFARQSAVMHACTGFLIAPDLLVTAGHCAVNHGEVKDERNGFCESFSWLFDYQVDHSGRARIDDVSPDRIYACKRVVEAKFVYDYEPTTQRYTFHFDYAVIQLDRPVSGRKSLVVAKSVVKPGERIFMIGYPSGLPAKVTHDGRVSDVRNPKYLRALLDVFAGNSGSPVFNTKNEVIGILVRGFPDTDFIQAPGRSCMKSATCSPDGKSCEVHQSEYETGVEIQRIRPFFESLLQVP
jgi:V8-like Glu-specific endopeptidase